MAGCLQLPERVRNWHSLIPNLPSFFGGYAKATEKAGKPGMRLPDAPLSIDTHCTSTHVYSCSKQFTFHFRNTIILRRDCSTKNGERTEAEMG